MRHLILGTILSTPLLFFSNISSAQNSAPVTLSLPNGSIDVISWSWDASQGGPIIIGEPDKSNPYLEGLSLSIKRKTDAQSAVLLEYMAEGTIIPEVGLTGPGVSITMKSVLVKYYKKIWGKAGKEKVQFNFAGITYSVDGAEFSYPKGGKEGGAGQAGWDLSKNAVK